jgi:hypothetical protein
MQWYDSDHDCYNYKSDVFAGSERGGKAWLACYNNLHEIRFLNVFKIDKSFGDADS